MEAALRKAVKQVKGGSSKIKVCRTLKVRWQDLTVALLESGVKSRFNKKPKDEKQRAVKLYEQGIVPKEMHKHGIKASWPSIYKWVQEAGCKTIRFNTRGTLRQELAKADFPEEQWKSYSKLVRRLSNDTYREYRDEIDPFMLRGREWHMDHRVSVYSAFLRGGLQRRLPIDVIFRCFPRKPIVGSSPIRS